MEQLIKALAVLGVMGVLAVSAICYAFYVAESHCWDPRGCTSHTAEAQRASDDAFAAGGHWGK